MTSMRSSLTKSSYATVGRFDAEAVGHDLGASLVPGGDGCHVLARELLKGRDESFGNPSWPHDAPIQGWRVTRVGHAVL